MRSLDKHEEYLSQFNDKELKWLETLSKLSPQDTNLKAMRRMDTMVDRPKYVKDHLHLLSRQKSTEFYDTHIKYNENRKYLYFPGVSLATVEYTN